MINLDGNKLYKFQEIFIKKRFAFLKIENPDSMQLENVENLQKNLRKIQKKINFIDQDEIDKLCKKIIQVLFLLLSYF